MLTSKKKTETVVVTLRIKEALRRRLETAAARNEVSVNSEITRRLEESFTRAELAGLTENVDRLSALYEHARARARASEELVERYRLNAVKYLELAQAANDPEAKRMLLNMADGWLALAAQREQNIEAASAGKPTSDDIGLDLTPRAPGAARAPDKEAESSLFRAMTSTGRPLPPDAPDQEPELPMPRLSKGDKS